ncbi:hypothetical protein T484DRAFT_2469952 [Baffinella frigidus]|nr:hypothetical protein T484DRAFT_2469952 [Cryptophyta sp. CCMP2293]
MTKGSKDELVARLEEDRMKGAGCGWRGCVGGRAAHLGECEWAPVKCRNQGCTESPLRRDLAEHDAFCGRREVECSFCERLMVCRSLAEHEGSCPRAKIECPNEGCGVQYTRGIMNVHRKGCEHEEVACPCPGCDARLLRKNMDAHLEERHLQGEATRPRLFSALKLLQRAWSRIALLEATAESEQSHAASSPTPEEWVFNWRADGWEMGTFKSERHTFRGEVEGWCTLQSLDSHFIGFGIERDGKCRVHATFSILDKHDKTLRQVCELGTATEPYEINGRLWGHKFTPTAEEKAQSVRADGSIRLRAVVRSSPTPRRRRGGGGGVGVRDGTEKALGERAAHGRVGVGD